MQLLNSNTHYSTLTKLLHWIIAACVLTQYMLIAWRDYGLPEGDPLRGKLIGQWHKPIGVLILFLTFLRITWRLCNPSPALPAHIRYWERLLARGTQFLLYVCTLVAPISGILMSQASGYSAALWTLFTVPQWVAKNKALAGWAYQAHVYSTWILFGLICLHIAGGLKHHFVHKDVVLRRMLPH